MKSAGILWYNPRNKVAEKQVITRLCRQYPSRHGEPCSVLTSVTIPDSVTSIGGSAFSGCSSLTDITLSDSVAYIGASAFRNTAYYNDSGNWENGVLFIDHWLICANEDISGDYEIKAGTVGIAVSAFYYCDNLASITIPDNAIYIGENAFGSCSDMTNVTIPNSVISIGVRAFNNCSSLTDVYYAGSEDDWNAIDIDDYNDPLLSANIHYGYLGIIVIPGICGSELIANEDITRYSIAKGDTVWVPSNQLRLADEAYANVLGFSKSPILSTYVSNYDIKAKSVSVTDENIGAQDTYTNLVNHLYEQYDTENGGNYDVQFFSYDWRYSITYGADALDQFIEDQGYTSVILVCHSMGGLVATQYISNTGGDKVEKLITIATPYLGAPKALYVLGTGYFLSNAWLSSTKSDL